MNKTKFNLARAAMTLLLALLGSTGAWAETKAAVAPPPIAVVSDIHVMAPSLLPEGAETQEAWTTYYAGQRKMLQQSAAIFTQFIDDMINQSPQVVLITGDLTKDGEMASHEFVREQLDRLTNMGIKAFVIPGNHDFGGSGTPIKFNADGTTETAEVLSYDEFKAFYYNFGYGWDSEFDSNSLSYVTEIMENLVLLAIDSHTTSIPAATLTWLCEKAKAARNAGKQVIAMMHHPLFPHITGADLFIDTYTVNDYETVRNALIDAGVNVILTGHFHTSDIAKDWNDDEGKAVYDVNTGSLISYPCDYRMLTPSYDNTTLKVETKSIVPAGMSKEECKTWLQGRMKGAATDKMNAKAGAMAAMAAEPISNIAEFAANLFVLHAEGDENASADREGLVTTYTTFKGDALYNAALSYGGITDASIYSVIDDKSNYGTDKENQTADRSLSIVMPEVGPFLPSEPGTITIGKAQYGHDLPITAQYKYALSQQVFSANEINHAKGKIWSLAFNTEKGDLTRNLTVYVTHTNQSSIYWEPVTEADCVFSGEVMFASGQWNTIYFDKPFEYDGKSNIVVTVDDNTGKSSGGWGVLSNYVFYGDGNCVVARDKNNDINPLDATSIENANQKDSYSYKSQIQFTFGDYPTPGNPAVTDIGDKSANVQCSLRGEATAWNLRYRKVAKEGEEEQRYVAVNDLTTRSYTIEGLDPATKYEVQVQAVFGEDNLSAWSDPMVFVTACCPVEEQAEIIYAVNSNYSSWYGYAIQFMDITDEKNPVEAAYINPIDYDFTGGTLTLCCGHKYQVNWIYDEEHSNVNGSFSLALYFEPGDKFFSMARGEAPEKTAELTTFVMDCTPYCAQMPQALTEAGTTYNSATITFVSQTTAGEVIYSTEANFDPNAVTPTSMDFTALSVDPNGWDPNPANASLTLTGLEPLTAYYVRVRSVCTAEPIGVSRWSDPIKVTTGSRYDAPTQVKAEPINSSSEGLSWSGRGNEKGYNLFYRAQAAGNPVDPSIIETFGGGEGKGFENGSWGDGIWSSYGDRPFSNTIFVTGVPAGSNFGFKAGNGKSGAGQTKFLYGTKKKDSQLTPLEQMKKFDLKCLDDDTREILIKGKKKQLDWLAQKLADGEFTQKQYDEQKAEIEAELAAYESQLTDAQKLERMKELEQSIMQKEDVLAYAADKYAKGEMTKEQFEQRKAEIEAENAQYRAELNELRAITTNAENPEKDGFIIVAPDDGFSLARTRGTEDDTYIFFIRHSDPNGVLLVKDLTITPPEQVNEWIMIPNITGTEYTLTGLEPNTAYEVMVEPIYEDGTTGSQSPITVFTTLGTENDPSEGVFTVSEDKKVNFAKGNLQHTGDMYEGTWSMAKQQYEMLGQDNVDKRENGDSYLADLVDLFCWSTAKNYNGLSFFTYYEEEDAKTYFQGDFEDWGTNASLISDLGSGWSTLSKDEWDYLLNERKNAASLKAFATVAGVQGLILLPDDWTEEAPAGTFTAEEWAMLEKDGAVFLPTAGQMTQSYDQTEYVTTTTVSNDGVEGFYWTSTPFDDNAGLNAFVLNFSGTNATPETDIYRRTASAVRLVKVAAVEERAEGDANGDGEVNVADVDYVIEHIGEPLDVTNKAADVNGDGEINVADVDYIIERIS